MAKKSGVNKTKAVSDYLKKHRKASPAEIAEALNKEGIKITVGHVANIKSKLKRMRLARKAAKPAAPATPAAASEAAPAVEKAAKPSDTITLEQIKKVAQTVKTIGGFDRLKELLEVVREVGGLRRFKDLLEAMSVTESGQPQQ